MSEGLAAYLPFRDQFAAIDPARYPARYIDEQIGLGFWRCWSNDRAAILAEIKTYPGGLREVHGIAAAGELEAIVDIIPLAEQWGRENKVAGAEIESVPAWAKIMEKHGYKVTQVRIWKEL